MGGGGGGGAGGLIRTRAHPDSVPVSQPLSNLSAHYLCQLHGDGRAKDYPWLPTPGHASDLLRFRTGCCCTTVYSLLSAAIAATRVAKGGSVQAGGQGWQLRYGWQCERRQHAPDNSPGFAKPGIGLHTIGIPLTDGHGFKHGFKHKVPYINPVQHGTDWLALARSSRWSHFGSLAICLDTQKSGGPAVGMMASIPREHHNHVLRGPDLWIRSGRPFWCVETLKQKIPTCHCFAD